MDRSDPPDFLTARAGAIADALAPDGSEIRLLGAVRGGGGQVWRREGMREAVADVEPGVTLTIPLGVHFQFRTMGSEQLRFVIVTIPPWPGAEEAVRVKDHWKT